MMRGLSVTVTEADDERRFLRRLQARDEHAFNELVQLYEGRVYRLVLRILGKPDEAEDMAQDVFVAVFRSVDKFRGDSKLSTWIYKIAINLCKNRGRYWSRRPSEAAEDLGDVEEKGWLEEGPARTTAELSAPDQHVQGYQVEEIVRRCIQELGPDYRDVVVLRDVEELRYEEIVEITGLPEGTVKSRLHRGRALLKARVSRLLGEKIE
ncbi:MAG: sigma-70 family RNA polymerase sigma factor [Polyangiaceae bacterium]|nr:sigma-70 family RNA polymerase sigma factor [Polyangiaceae bacterium]